MTVLLVHKSRSAADTLSAALAQRGIDARIATDGSEGLRSAQKLLPDAIILTADLGRSSGYALCSKLKRDRRLKDTPVILMAETQDDEAFDRHKKMKTRAQEYLGGPVDADTIVELLRAYIPEPDPTATPPPIPMDAETLPDAATQVMPPPVPTHEGAPSVAAQLASDEDLADSVDVDPLAEPPPETDEAPDEAIQRVLADLAASGEDAFDDPSTPGSVPPVLPEPNSAELLSLEAFAEDVLNPESEAAEPAEPSEDRTQRARELEAELVSARTEAATLRQNLERSQQQTAALLQERDAWSTSRDEARQSLDDVIAAVRSIA